MTKGYFNQNAPEQNEWRSTMQFLDETSQLRGTVNFPSLAEEMYSKLNQRRRKFATFPEIQLEKNHEAKIETLEKTLSERTSVRSFRSEPITFESFSTLFWLSAAIKRSTANGFSFRSWPSAGGLYPIDLFVVSRNVQKIPGGISYYDPFAHSLRVLQNADAVEGIHQALLGGQPWISQAAFSIIFVADLDKTVGKYGERGMRYIFIDAGHLAQNLTLVGHAIGMGSCAIGGFYENEIHGILGLNSVDEYAVYALAFGLGNSQEVNETPTH